jgi:hypothetical protein
MRWALFVFVMLLVGGCTSQTASLDGARTQVLEARADYQNCVNGTSGEVVNQCEAKLMAADDAERAYRTAMSSGIR